MNTADREGGQSVATKRSCGKGREQVKKPDDLDLSTLQRMVHIFQRGKILIIAKGAAAFRSSRHATDLVHSEDAEDAEEAWLSVQEMLFEFNADQSNAHCTVSPPVPAPHSGAATPG